MGPIFNLADARYSWDYAGGQNVTNLLWNVELLVLDYIKKACASEKHKNRLHQAKTRLTRVANFLPRTS